MYRNDVRRMGAGTVRRNTPSICKWIWVFRIEADCSISRSTHLISDHIVHIHPSIQLVNRAEHPSSRSTYIPSRLGFSKETQSTPLKLSSRAPTRSFLSHQTPLEPTLSLARHSALIRPSIHSLRFTSYTTYRHCASLICVIHSIQRFTLFTPLLLLP